MYTLYITQKQIAIIMKNYRVGLFVNFGLSNYQNVGFLMWKNKINRSTALSCSGPMSYDRLNVLNV